MTSLRNRITVMLVLAGLAVACRGKTKAPAVTSAPRPNPVAASAEPLSSPQTGARLPPYQPVPPEALPPPAAPRRAEAAPGPAPASPPKPTTETARPRPAPPRSESAPPQPAPTTPQPAPAPPALRPVLTPQQEQDLRRRIDQSLRGATQALAKAGSDPARQPAADRVRAFIDQAEQARRQGDLVRARSFAERAEALAADLARSTK